MVGFTTMIVLGLGVRSGTTVLDQWFATTSRELLGAHPYWMLLLNRVRVLVPLYLLAIAIPLWRREWRLATVAAVGTGGLFLVRAADRTSPSSLDRQAYDMELTRLRTLIEEHVRRTGSLHGKTILDNWALELRNFVHVVPKESLSRLAAPLELKAAE